MSLSLTARQLTSVTRPTRSPKRTQSPGSNGRSIIRASPAKRFESVSCMARPSTIDSAAEVAMSAVTSTPSVARRRRTRTRAAKTAEATSRRMLGGGLPPRRTVTTSQTTTSPILKAV